MKKRLLLVEDDPDDAALFRAALSRPELLELEVVRDGQEALDRLASGGAPVDLVVLDLQLPRVTGLEVLSKLKRAAAPLLAPIVIFSSSREPSDLAAAYRGGANSFVRKPVSADEFEAAVRQIESYWLGLNEPAAER